MGCKVVIFPGNENSESTEIAPENKAKPVFILLPRNDLAAY